MGQKRVMQGTVVSDKMDKTVVVSVARRKKHKLYRKVISVTSHYKAHDETNRCRIGDEVRIIEARPMSRTKRWRVFEVLTKGDVAEIQPDTIGRELEEQTQIATKREEAEQEAAAIAEEEAEAAEAEAAADEESAAEEDGDEENRE
jgi:small subunit ribosomal protein S17